MRRRGKRAYLGSAPAGDDAEVDLGLAEDGGGRREDDVAHEGEFTASAELCREEDERRGTAVLLGREKRTA